MQGTFAEKPQMKINNFIETKTLMSNSYIGVILILPSLHRGSLEITLTVPLSYVKYKMSEILQQNLV